MANKIRIVDHAGRHIGHIKRASYEKRQWPSDFCSLDSNNYLHLHWESQQIVPRMHNGTRLDVCKYVDDLYRDYCASKEKDAQAIARKRHEKEQERKKETAQLARFTKRRKLIERYLADRSDACVAHVTDLFWTKSDSELEPLVANELRLRPNLYADVEGFAHVKLMALALANMFDRGADVDIEPLLKQAHLFVFDDDAWWAAHNYSGSLERLPYPICLVEDVLIWNEGGGIKVLALTEEAQVDTSRALLAFVVDRCSSNSTQAEGTSSLVEFIAPLEPLPGTIVQAAIVQRNKSTASSVQRGIGRSPRPHTRRGHWRNQAYGEGLKLRKRIWISDTLVTPSGKKYRIDEVSRIHLVKLATPE